MSASRGVRTVPDRKAEIEAVFDEAMELPPDRRDAWLAARCGADDVLRAEVDALLSGLDHAERFFDPQAPAISRMARELLPIPAGLRIGQYDVVRELGRGGMGVVYLAERADGHHRRRVAIKVVRIDDGNKDIRRRFLAEGRILASLSHPNIAQLLDAGVMDDGTPYIVMEYVDGATITAYCKREHLNVVARLRLFQEVCAAVHHAHSNLVLHRDVKPGNILVTRDGHVKLLDFGIAKLIESGNGGLSNTGARDTLRDETRTGARPMTPAYASPEQIRGEPLSTASDVYALGLVLYEMLAGVRPYEVEEHPPAVALALISEKEPSLPSARGSRFAAELRGDLDAIVMKALRKEPAQRYGSADQLSADIGRYLGGLPVTAHSGNRFYRMRRFVGRHRVAVATTALLFTGVAGGVSLALWQAQQASRARAAADVARDRAVAAHDESEQVSDFLIGLFDNRDDYGSLRDTLVLKSFLARGMKRLNEIHEPLARASLLDALGRVEWNLGNVDGAERLMWEALALREQRAGRSDPATALTLERLADLQRRRGNYTLADSLAMRALDINRALYGRVHPRVAYNLHQRSSFSVYLNKLPVAESLAVEAVAARAGGSSEADSLMAREIETLGSVRWRRGKFDEAVAAMQEAERIARRRRAYPDPLAVEFRMHRATLIGYVPGRASEAVALARQALAEQYAAVPEGDPRRSIAIGWAAPIIAMQDMDEAMELLRVAIATDTRAFSEKDTRVLDHKGELALMLLRKGRMKEAIALLADVTTRTREQYGVQHTAYAGILGILGSALIRAGNVDSAETVIRKAVAIRMSIFGPNAPITALSSTGLAMLSAARGDTAAADSIYGAAREIISRQTTKDHPDVKWVDSLRAELHSNADRQRKVSVNHR